jgi:hypothetical protein
MKSAVFLRELEAVPNKALNRSAQEHRSWVPAARRAAAPGYAERWASA